jgi:hypothetical protein
VGKYIVSDSPSYNPNIGSTRNWQLMAGSHDPFVSKAGSVSEVWLVLGVLKGSYGIPVAEPKCPDVIIPGKESETLWNFWLLLS